jgi:hypothetical protein
MLAYGTLMMAARASLLACLLLLSSYRHRGSLSALYGMPGI